MGCGKGYLTFAISTVLGPKARCLGVEARGELVELCNRIAAEQGFAPRLAFIAGTIEDTPVECADVLIALHACDTATDDALAKGIAAGARLVDRRAVLPKGDPSPTYGPGGARGGAPARDISGTPGRICHGCPAGPAPRMGRLSHQSA